MKTLFDFYTPQTAAKKALFVATSPNELQRVTARSLELTFQAKGSWNFEYTSIYALGKEISKFEEKSPRDFSFYDLIIIMPIFNAMFVSGRGTSIVFKNIVEQVKEDRLVFYNDDVTLYTNSRVMNVRTRQWEESFIHRPLKILANFTDDVYSHPTALQQAKERWYRHLHPATEIIPVEMTIPWTEARKETLKTEFLKSLQYDYKLPTIINGFYCGLHKRRVIPSLKKLGFGAHRNDVVMGPIAHRFPLAKNMTLDNSYTPFPILANFIEKAKYNYLPYEKIKSDVQPSPRLAELLVATTPDFIVHDERIHKNILALVDNDTRKKRLEIASEKLNTIF